MTGITSSLPKGNFAVFCCNINAVLFLQEMSPVITYVTTQCYKGKFFQSFLETCIIVLLSALLHLQIAQGASYPFHVVST